MLIALQEVLFPLLTEVRTATESAATEEVAPELGKEGGKSVKMYLFAAFQS
jgi:hypothetical protein